MVSDSRIVVETSVSGTYILGHQTNPCDLNFRTEITLEKEKPKQEMCISSHEDAHSLSSPTLEYSNFNFFIGPTMTIQFKSEKKKKKKKVTKTVQTNSTKTKLKSNIKSVSERREHQKKKKMIFFFEWLRASLWCCDLIA